MRRASTSSSYRNYRNGHASAAAVVTGPRSAAAQPWDFVPLTGNARPRRAGLVVPPG
ncbi:hypothetical protein [Sorangium cellulosum]|uniref:hypothetical protein n=1 Tax=Sorangium cellulosum TaxID=56 RepID=UPI001331A0D1|nr:hypothetical protein [Sorangium cellulosum]